MKIATWNVNGIRTRIFDSLNNSNYEKAQRELKRACKQAGNNNETFYRKIRDNSSLDNLLKYNIDFLCFQETRCSVEASELLKIDGYKSIFNESKLTGARQAQRYSGTCIYYKEQYEDRISKIEYQIPNYNDTEGRIIMIYLDDCTKLIINVYVPNSGTNLENRILFQEAMLEFLSDCISKSIEVIYCGDFNVAYQDSDIHFNYEKSSTYKKIDKDTTQIVGFLPVEREFIQQLLDINMIDTFTFTFAAFATYFTHPSNNNDGEITKNLLPSDFKGFTWWDQRCKKVVNKNDVQVGLNRFKNNGWRLDYIFTGNIPKEKIIKCEVLKHIGEENDTQSSDHACVVCEFESY